MVKEDRLGFRADQEISKGLEQLSKKLNVVESEIIRIGIKELMEKHLGVESDVIVIDRHRWDVIVKGFSKQLKEEIFREITDKILKQPGIQKLRKAAREGKLEIVEK